MPFTEVLGLAQTEDGILWLGTVEGLFRFDGVRFTRMDELSRKRIDQLLATRDGSLWIVFESRRVSRLSEGKIKNFSQEELPTTVNAVAEDRDGSIVAATARGGLFRYRDGHWQDIATPLQLSATRSIYVWFDRDGGLWLQTEDRVLELPPGASRFTDPGIPARTGSFKQHIFDQSPDGTIWFGDVDSTRAISPDGAKTVILEPTNSVRIDREGSLWIGGDNDALLRIAAPSKIAGKVITASDPHVERFAKKEGLSGNRVYSVLQDREHNIWAGTIGGLDQFREGLFHKIAVPDADVIALYPSADGGVTLWLRDSRFLKRVEPNGKAQVFRLSETATKICRDDADGSFWVATSEGFGKWTGKGIFYPPQPPPNGAIIRLGCGNGDVWSSSVAQGVLRFSGGKLTRIPEIPPQANALFPLSEGVVWAAYQDGTVRVYDHGAIRRYGAEDGLPDGITRSIVRGADGDLWLAGQGGLARFRNGRFQRADIVPGLHFDALESGDNGFLWLEAGKVLIRISVREFDRAATDPGYRPAVETYGNLDGIPGVVQAMTRSGDRIWISTSEGMGYLNLQPHAVANPLPPTVEIETVMADDKVIAASQGVTLPKLTHHLRIDYTAFSLTVPERVRFRYKLEGVEKDWQQPTALRQAYYTDLAPQKYRFIVKACNNDGVWNEEGAALDFFVAPAYYQTNWFQATCLAAFLAFLWGVYRLRLRQIAHQFDLRLEERIGERTRIARELHDTLLQSFQGSLYEFQAARKLLSGRPEEAGRTLDRAIGSAGAAIDEGREAIQELRSASAVREDLAQLLRAAGQESSGAKSSNENRRAFHVTVEGPPRSLSPILQDELYRIGRELLRNAFRHARAKRIEVEIRYSAQELRLRIRDDGTGIDPEVLETGARPGHWGLPGVRERAKRIGAELDLWSQARRAPRSRLPCRPVSRI